MLEKPSIRSRFLVGRFLIFAGLVFLVGMTAVLFLARVQEKVYADGRIRARHREDVRSRTSGVIASVLRRDGDHVVKGDVLATLDDAELRDKLQRQREALARSEAESAVSDRKLAKLRIDTLPEKLRFVQMDHKQAELQMKLAQSEWRTAAKLTKDGVTSRRELQKLRTKYELTVNAMEIAGRKVKLVRSGLGKAILDEAAAGVAVVRQQVEACRAECRRLEEQLDRHIVRAPSSGWIVLALKRPGESVKPGEMVFRIQTSERLELRVMVPEEHILKVEPGQKVLIYSAMFGYEKYGLAKGTVLYVASCAEDMEGKASYMVCIEVESSPMPLRIGSTAQARILVQKRTILEMLVDSTG